MHKIRTKMNRVGLGIRDMYKYIGSLPAWQRRDARAALRKAFEVGCTFEGIRHYPENPPIREDGTIVIGPEMRRHIRHVRQVCMEVGQLREIVSRLLDDEAQDMLVNFAKSDWEPRSGVDEMQLAT